MLTVRVDLLACSTAEEFAVKLTTAVLADRHRAFGTMTLSGADSERVAGRRVVPAGAFGCGGCRIVVLVDEFQKVERLGGERLTQRMRAHCQGPKLAAYLLLGRCPTVMSHLFADRHAALCRFADAVPVRPPEPEAWVAYMSARW